MQSDYDRALDDNDSFEDGFSEEMAVPSEGWVNPPSVITCFRGERPSVICFTDGTRKRVKVIEKDACGVLVEGEKNYLFYPWGVVTSVQFAKRPQAPDV